MALTTGQITAFNTATSSDATQAAISTARNATDTGLGWFEKFVLAIPIVGTVLSFLGENTPLGDLYNGLKSFLVDTLIGGLISGAQNLWNDFAPDWAKDGVEKVSNGIHTAKTLATDLIYDNSQGFLQSELRTASDSIKQDETLTASLQPLADEGLDTAKLQAAITKGLEESSSSLSALMAEGSQSISQWAASMGVETDASNAATHAMAGASTAYVSVYEETYRQLTGEDNVPLGEDLSDAQRAAMQKAHSAASQISGLEVTGISAGKAQFRPTNGGIYARLNTHIAALEQDNTAAAPAFALAGTATQPPAPAADQTVTTQNTFVNITDNELDVLMNQYGLSAEQIDYIKTFGNENQLSDYLNTLPTLEEKDKTVMQAIIT